MHKGRVEEETKKEKKMGGIGNRIGGSPNGGKSPKKGGEKKFMGK